MKKILSLVLGGVVAVAMASMAFAGPYNASEQGAPGGANATNSGNPATREDILNSRHNFLKLGDFVTVYFGDASTSTTRAADGTLTYVDNSGQVTQAQLCVFCHTPHGSNTNGTAAQIPLWNRAIANDGALASTLGYAATYTLYGGTTTLDSTPGQPLGVSAACLSCHDGVIGVDAALYNAPGFLGANADRIHVSVDPAVGPAGAGELLVKAGTEAFGDIGFNTASLTFPGLGTNLSNDHPISMLYPVTGNGPVNDPQFRPIGANGKINAPASGTGITDSPFSGVGYVQLYQSAGTGGGWYVECASCHNPHLGSPDKGSTINNTTQFLRVSSRNSEICFTCHNK